MKTMKRDNSKEKGTIGPIARLFSLNAKELGKDYEGHANYGDTFFGVAKDELMIHFMDSGSLKKIGSHTHRV